MRAARCTLRPMDLAEDEQLLFEGHPSWRSILGFYTKGVVAAMVVGAIVAVATRVANDKLAWGLVGGIVAVVIAVVLALGLIKRISTTYKITNHRLSIRRGIISRARQETRLDRVQNVNTSQSAWQRILQVGTVDFDTAGSDQFDFAFVGVADPEEIVKVVDRAQREALKVEGAPPR